MNKYNLPNLINELIQPIAICDGHEYGGQIEDELSDLFNNNSIQFDECYNLYNSPIDLTKYKTICFYTTNTYVDKVAKIMNFDYSNIQVVVAIGEWAYDLVRDISKEKNIKLLTFDMRKNKIVDAKLYFGY